MSDARERQRAMLSHMGIGPVWTWRQAAPERGADLLNTAAVEDPPAGDDSRPEFAPAASTVIENPVSAAPASVQPVTSALDWPTLEQSVSSCTACGLCHGRNRTVFGVGERKASWLFVGEGPGRQEDLKGEPFVGPAGKLLDNMLKSLGLGRDANAYIANVVKCRPTGEEGRDRPPTPEEVAACLPFLRQQLELIQPDVIVALGRIAAVSLLGLPPDTPVSSLRGKLHQFQGKPLVVTYHPAYLLRQPADKAKVWRDLCMARAAHAARA